MKIDGGCHCGHVQYEAEVTTDTVVICHCTDCQKLSAGAYRIVVPSKETEFSLLANPPKDYIKTSNSGTPRIQAFCPECGSHIYATSVDNIGARVFNIRLGTINQKEQFSPTGQIWCRSAQPWAFNIEDVPRTEMQ
jgi:hypothetical protein|tara:strand:+ start:3224 stop:3631 length:408 start_codon:yes stop_codon:yes gene_type:complete